MYTSSLNIYCSYAIIVYGQKKIDFLWKQFNICYYLLYKTSIYVVINVCYCKILWNITFTIVWVFFDTKCLLSWHSTHQAYPSRHVLIQTEQWKHQNNVWNLFKVNKLTRQWHHSAVLIINFEQISNIAVLFPLSTLNK